MLSHKTCIFSHYDPRLDWRTKLKYQDVDLITGHVKVQYRQEPAFWVPFVLLYAMCTKDKQREKLMSTIRVFMQKRSLLTPYPISEVPRLTKLSIDSQWDIDLLHYWPALRDGTIWGDHERIVYRLRKPKGAVLGVARLKDVQRWSFYKTYPEALASFVDGQRVKIH